MGYFDNLLANMRSNQTEFDESFDESSDFDKEAGQAEKEFDNSFAKEDSDLEEGCGQEGCGSHCEDDDDINSMLADMFGDDDLDDDIDEPDDFPDDMDDLSDLDDLGDEEPETDVDVPVELESVLGDPVPAQPLEADADAEADRVMALTATPIMANDVMTEEEAMEFIESGDADIAVSEGMLLQEDVAEIATSIMDDTGVYTESVFAAPGKKFKMTKKARLKQLYELSIQIEARQHNDPYYPKMQKAYKTERMIKSYWRKKYGALALRRAKNYLKKLSASKSSGLKKIASKISGKK